jgi:hypothetical protein
MAGKDSGLRIRIERPLREAFLEACSLEDRPAAQVLREFMRLYVARHDMDDRLGTNAQVRKGVRRKVSEP